ncbi:MAG: hypothetical protein N2248_00410 [candidate division WOR-3 bacterium]|nr:hypothetical protein [candidate division WOR-3 bacterium]
MADNSLLQRLKDRLGSSAASRLGDEALGSFLLIAQQDYNLTDPAVIINLALYFCYRRLAAETAAQFKFSQGSESVDKTEESKNWLALAESIWQTLPESIRVQGEPRPDTFIYAPDPESE